MEPDYYRVLCVDPSADRAGIETAYRRKAIKCHPDRGGCHRQMVLVNEAWEVLSNPDLRRAYDEARAMAADQAAKPATAPEPLPSQRQAPTAEPRWGIFEPLRIAIAQDFARANFRPGLRKWIGWSMAGDSVSGFALVSVGTVTGGLAIAKLLSMESAWMGAHPFAAFLFMGGGVVIGGELAVKLHQRLASSVFTLTEPL
jgi:curved DNA-binding protein CbpA